MRRLRWNTVERGCAAAAEVAVIYPLYLLGMLYVLGRDDRAQLIRPEFVRAQVPVFALVALGAVLLWGFGLWLRHRRPHSLVYQHVAANYFGAALVWAGYVTGTLNLAAGVVLMGAAVTGYIVLDRRVIVPAFVNALTLLVLFTLGSSLELLPYAPALVPPRDASTSLFWLHTHFFLAAPHLVFCVLATLFMLGQWRRSEARILRLGTTDGLTGLYNRRSILAMLQGEESRARENDTGLAVGLLDLDHFKVINDRLGHVTGDRVLRAVAQTLRYNLPGEGRVGRFGGEEFLVVLPGVRTDEAQARMEGLRRGVEELAIHDDEGEPIRVTASFGLAFDPGGADMSADVLINGADDALYQAKCQGRNQVKTLRPAVAAACSPDAVGDGGFRVRYGEQALPDGPEPEYAEAREWLRRRITGMRHLTETAMAALMTALISVQYLGYLLWCLYTIQREDRAELVNMPVFRDVVWFVTAALGVALGLALLGYSLMRRGLESPVFILVSHQFYGLTLVGFGYLVGLLSLPTGIVLLASPLLGLMFFRQWVIAVGFATALVALVGAAYAEALGAIPYAPLVPETAVHFRSAEPFWVLSFYYFVVPMLVFTLILLDQVLGMWRQRGHYIQSLSVTDGLTRLNNRRRILSRLENAITEARRVGNPLSLVLLDIDYFKAINDDKGHPVGDGVLRRIALNLGESARQGDLVGRYGGEEFLVVLPATTLNGALALAERYRSRLSEVRMTDDAGHIFHVTGSFGVATLDPMNDAGAEALVQRADRALYAAKDNGRNRIETLDETADRAVEPAG